MKLLLRYQSMLFFLTIILFQGSIAQEALSEYRIQIAALPRVKLDSLKNVGSNIEEKLQLKAYILDQQGFYKIAVGDFSTFSQAREKLEIVRSFYHDAWIIPAFHEFVIYPETTDSLIGISPHAAEISEPVLSPQIPQIPEFIPKPETVLILEDSPIFIEPELPLIDIPRVSVKQKRFFHVIHGGIVYIDLHASTPDTRYCDYYGFGFGLGTSYAITKNLLFSLSADYSMANAFPIAEKHEVTGDASVIRINPAIIVGSNAYSKFGIYGRLGMSYFNYDYSYSMELKPGYSGGPASVDAELLERAYTYGLDAGIGVRIFRRIELTSNAYYDLNQRLYLSLKLGLVF